MQLSPSVHLFICLFVSTLTFELGDTLTFIFLRLKVKVRVVQSVRRCVRAVLVLVEIAVDIASCVTLHTIRQLP